MLNAHDWTNHKAATYIDIGLVRYFDNTCIKVVTLPLQGTKF
jgi:hypothetical protein